MYFLKKYRNGAAHDARSFWQADFKCPSCRNIETVKIKHDADVSAVDKQCPKCKQYGINTTESIQNQIKALTETKSNIEVQIETLTKQLETVTQETT